MLNKAVEQLLQLAGRFGMSPADRVRLGEEPDDETPDDPFAEHLRSIARVTDEPITESNEPPRGRKVSRRKTQRKTAGRKK